MLRKALPVVSRITAVGLVGMLVAWFVRFKQARAAKRGFFHRVFAH